jgi:hypothetical protein
MSEGHTEDRPEERRPDPVESELESPATAAPARGQRGSRGAVLLLSGVLILIVAGIALSPFWATDVEKLLPWGARSGTSAEDYAALAARVTAVEKRPAPPSVDVNSVKSAMGALGRRVEQLETGVNARLAEIEKSPVSPSTDIDALKSQESALAHRVDQLEVARKGDGQIEAVVAATQTKLQQLEQQLTTVEAQTSARAASEAAELQNSEQELAQLGSLTAELGKRVPALEQQLRSQGDAERTDAVLALLLLQMREAVDQARPFPAEYDAFMTLARDPDLKAAAEPLAAAARNGVASRAVLKARLAEFAGRVATTSEPATESDWGAQALARLRGLVTIRRIDGASQTGPEAAVSDGQTALARGDLAGAVAALDPLSGANGEAVRPWLRMARQRLAVDTALDHLQELLTVRLGSTRATPTAAPPGAPHEPSEKARAPS